MTGSLQDVTLDMQKSPVRPGADVPGYLGYIAGKIPEPNVIGGTFHVANALAASKTRPQQSGLGDQQVAGAEDIPEVRKAETPPVTTGKPLPLKERYAVKSVPGYSGFIPGKESGNIVGATWQPGNTRAVKEVTASTRARSKPTWRRCSGPGIESRRNSGAALGRQIPGYTGWVGGKAPEAGVCGMTWSRANDRADRLARKAKTVSHSRRQPAQEAGLDGRGKVVIAQQKSISTSGTSSGTGRSSTGTTASSKASADPRRGASVQHSGSNRPGKVHLAAAHESNKGRIPGYSGHVPLHWNGHVPHTN